MPYLRDVKEFLKAVKENDIHQVQELINAKADVNAENICDDTVLIWAALKGCTEIAKMLINANIDANEKDNNDKTPLERLNKDKFSETAELLKDAMAHPEKYKPLNEEERSQIAKQVQELSAKEIKQLPETDTDLLPKLCVLNGIMAGGGEGLDYTQKISLYAKTYNKVSSEVKGVMENSLKKTER